jgi:hypothetical protein
MPQMHRQLARGDGDNIETAATRGKAAGEI